MKIFYFILIIIGIIGFIFLSISQVFSSPPENVLFLNHNMGSMKRNEIVPYLQLLEKQWVEPPLEVEVLDKKFLIDKKALSIRWNLPQIKKELGKAKNENQVIPLIFLWDEKKAEEAFQFIAHKTDTSPRNAFVQEGRIHRSSVGYRLDPRKAIEEVRDAISHGSNKISISSFEFLPPEVNTEQLLGTLGFEHLLAFHETSLLGRDEKTRFNINKSAQRINGSILEKGEVFSFNQIIGPADKEDGYLETKVVVNGKLVPGYGGGICQVSSTLYNALLKCNALILERSPHSGYSETTSYVNPGLDAAVSYGYKDLKFRFPDQRTVIFTYVDQERLVAEIWGEKENSQPKTITSQIRRITENGNQDAFLEVETTISIQNRIEKRYRDTYLVSADYGRILKKNFSEDLN